MFTIGKTGRIFRSFFTFREKIMPAYFADSENTEMDSSEADYRFQQFIQQNSEDGFSSTLEQ